METKEFSLASMKGILSRSEMKQITGGVQDEFGCAGAGVSCEVKKCCPNTSLICESSEQPVCVVDCNG